MKKTFKRLGAMFLAMVMAVSVLCTGALADDNTSTIKVPDSLTDHTFVAYQIFSGTQSADSTKLASVQWGTGINSETFLKALTEDTTFSAKGIKTTSSAADVAEALDDVGNKSDVAKKFAKLAFKNKQGEGTTLRTGSNSLEKGYYLIVDTTSTDNGQGVAKNTALLQVTGSEVEIEAKTGVPTVDKKVNSKDDYDTANIGDTVTFTLIGSLPDNYEYFGKYEYTFKDTLSAGLTFDENSVTVKVGDTALKKATSGTDTSGYYVSASKDNDGKTKL